MNHFLRAGFECTTKSFFTARVFSFFIAFRSIPFFLILLIRFLPYFEGDLSDLFFFFSGENIVLLDSFPLFKFISFFETHSFIILSPSLVSISSYSSLFGTFSEAFLPFISLLFSVGVASFFSDLILSNFYFTLSFISPFNCLCFMQESLYSSIFIVILFLKLPVLWSEVKTLCPTKFVFSLKDPKILEF